jgi:hypothetical protein
MDIRPTVPRFSLRQLLLAVALFAAGLSLMLAAVRSSPVAAWRFNPAYGILLWLSGGPLVGAGVMTPWGRPLLGALLGFQIQIVLMIIAISFFGAE